MSKKDIKSKKNTFQIPVNTPNWKNEIRNAVNAGMEVEGLNEEQTEYINKCIADKKAKEEKIKAREEKKQSLLKKASEALKQKKLQILEVANALADRILCKAIEKEEREAEFAKRKEEIKKKVDKETIAKAEKKRERKTDLLNRSIPSKEAIAANKNRQNFLAKAHTQKREEIEKQLQAKIDYMKEEATKVEEKRNARKEKELKLASKRLEMHKAKKDGTFKLKHTTKEERIEAIKAEKAVGKAGYTQELKKQASEIEADRKGYMERVLKREESERQRLERIIEHRQARKDKEFSEKLKQQKITQRNLNRFIESEKNRLARKEEHRAKYLTGGGIAIPKVKNKIEVDKQRAEEYMNQTATKVDNKERYLIRIASTNNPSIITDSVGAFICKPEDLQKRLKEAHNHQMKDNPDTYVGIYAYSGIGKDQVCIAEMINDKFLEFEGKSTSRINAEAKAA